jgi:uncharacterized protein (DUF58 family)
MLTTADILRQVRRLEIRTKGLSQHMFAGDYHSAFKGRGMSFSEVREYTPGDDVKSIDWNVTARLRTPYIKVFEEERELTVMLLIDISASSLFGTVRRTKRALIAEVASVLAFSASLNGDKVGAVLFAGGVEKIIRPSKGRSHLLRIVREAIALEPARTPGTDLNAPLRFLNTGLKRRSVVFLLSDFISPAYDATLRLAARRHDLIGLRVWDRADRDLPHLGLVEATDPETGIRGWIDTEHGATRAAYAKNFDAWQAYAQGSFRQSGADLLSLRTEEDYVPVLHRFFAGR